MIKKWYKSKTVWSAILKALSGVLASLALVLSGEVMFIDFLPGAITLIWGVIDVIIRFQTSQDLKL